MSHTALKIFRNAFSNWTRFALSMIIAFIMSPYIIHSLGDTRYGIWSLITALSGYMLLLDIGIGSSITRYVSSYNRTGNMAGIVGVVNSSVALYFLIGLTIVLFSPLIAFGFITIIPFDEKIQETVFLMVIIISFDAAILLVRAALRAVLQGFQRYDLINAVFCGLSVVQAVLFYFLLSWGYRLIAMALVAMMCNVSAVVSFFVLVKIKFPFIKFSPKRVRKSDCRIIVNYSIFTFINMIANQVIYYSDSFVVGFFLSAAHITYYSIAWSLMEYVKRFCVAFTGVFVPAISEFEAVSDYQRIRDMLNRGTKYTLVMILPFCIGLTLFGEPFIRLWMGAKYAMTCTNILIVLVACQFFELPQMISSSVLFGISRHRLMSYAGMTAAIANLVLSIVLVQYYGLLGVAWGTAIPQMLLYGVFMPLYVNHVTGQPVANFFKETYFRLLLPAGILFFLLHACIKGFYPDSYLKLLAEAALCTLIYLMASYLVALDKKEQGAIKNFISRLFEKRVTMVSETKGP